MKEKEPFYLHPPAGEKSRVRREGRPSVRQSGVESVRFSDQSQSQHSHKTRDTQDRQRRDRDRESYRDRDRERERDRDRDKERERSEKIGRRMEKDDVKTGRRSHSVEESNVRQTERRRRTPGVEARRQEYYESDERMKERKLNSSRSKSHDESDRCERRERVKRSSEDDGQPAPFYLHSGVAQHSSSQSQSPYSHNNGYERIQSLFYESLDNLDNSQHIESNKKTRRRSREFSPEKKGFDLHYKDSNNNNSSKHSHNERRKSPKRRAAPQMPLPPIDYKGF